MGKAIYSLKIYLFRDQFKLFEQEAGILDICSVVVKCNINSWFQAASVCFVPRNDLQLLKSLKEYEGINYESSKCAMNKFLGHLWYLSEELVALVLLGDYISQDLRTEENDEPLKRTRVDPDVVLKKGSA
ncbi:hypothetical protein AVEN_93493-1 [Araneus ventricosus]|uniref:Uncharacterized protein n=1 Tax=Araneus ventricosus TaxID=182803 RepID=A0A4Y2AQC6_ARAVE|nr:hypothetical protein AVEN_93493-1 [Araneus ventricosus]